MRNHMQEEQVRIARCLEECKCAHDDIGGDFSRLALYGEALIQLAKAYESADDLKAALGAYKKARAAFFIAAHVKPIYHRRVAELDSVIEDLL